MDKGDLGELTEDSGESQTLIIGDDVSLRVSSILMFGTGKAGCFCTSKDNMSLFCDRGMSRCDRSGVCLDRLCSVNWKMSPSVLLVLSLIQISPLRGRKRYLFSLVDALARAIQS